MTDNTRATPPIEHDDKRIVVGRTKDNERVFARWTPMKGTIGKPNYTKEFGGVLRFPSIDTTTIPRIILQNTDGMAVTTSAQLTKAAVPIWLEATGQDPASWGKKESGAENGLSRAKARKGKGKDGGRAAVSGVRKPFTILNAKKKLGKKDVAKYLKMFNNLKKEPSVADMAQIQLATASAHPRLEIPTVEWIKDVRETAKENNEKPEDSLQYAIWRAEATKEDGLAEILQGDPIDTAEETGTATNPDGQSEMEKKKFWDNTRATLALLLKK